MLPLLRLSRCRFTHISILPYRLPLRFALLRDILRLLSFLHDISPSLLLIRFAIRYSLLHAAADAAPPLMLRYQVIIDTTEEMAGGNR